MRRSWVRAAVGTLVFAALAGCAPPPFDAGGTYHGQWAGALRQEGAEESGGEVSWPISLLLSQDMAGYPLNRVVTGAFSFDWTYLVPEFAAPVGLHSLEAPLRGYVDESGALIMGAGICIGEVFCVTLDIDAVGDDCDGDGLMDWCGGRLHGQFQVLNMAPILVEGEFEVVRAWSG